MYRHSCNQNVAGTFVSFVALWYLVGTLVLWHLCNFWHKRNFVAFVHLLWERLGPRLDRSDQHSIWRTAASYRVSDVKFKVAIFSLLSTFCAPSTSYNVTTSIKKTAKKVQCYRVFGN